ncbi:hypothetical protein GCM10022222_39430 [Amycolatopsis ultiminotia]|uniref:Uncharacterized protein n=2 Tax=Amycolatopsis ultiminotia TaxID=543629 RepID=A0ABP6WIB2_9PSEU
MWGLPCSGDDIMNTRSTKRRIRAAAKRTGESYTRTIRAKEAARDSREELSGAALALAKPNLLLGVRVEATRRGSGRETVYTGVIVSSAVTRRLDIRCRVALLSVPDWHGSESVVEIDSAKWDLRPTPEEIAEVALRGERRCLSTAGRKPTRSTCAPQ